MKRYMIVAGLFLFVISVHAKDKFYEKGILLQMESSACGLAEKGSKTLAGEFLGTDGEHKNTQELLCQEYVLQADRVIYRIRPKDGKHPVILPIGETAEFRIARDKLILRIPETNDKEHEYSVVSITPRADLQAARGGRTASTR